MKLILGMYHGAAILTPNSCVHTVAVTLVGVEAEIDCSCPFEAEASSCPANTDSSSTTAVGLFLGGVVAGALGVLLIAGIVCGAWRLRRTKHK